MGYLFLLMYLSAILIRPHEWFSIGAVSPVIRITMILTFFAYLLTQDNKKMAPQYILVFLLSIPIAMSAISNGWGWEELFLSR